MPIITATGPLLDEILTVTFDVWHEGLSREAYARWNLVQQRTPWGRQHLHRVALIDDENRLLSSAKLYRHRARLDGRDVEACGLGAVFTPPALRGRGHATRLVEGLIDAERQRGAALMFLFSEIGPAFYERLGFRPVPVDEMALDVDHGRGAPAMLVRSGDERDLPAVSAMHDRRIAGVRLALQRPPAVVQFALARKRVFAAAHAPGIREVEFVVAEEGASAVAYAVITGSAHGWTLEEAGDRDPAGARLGAILQVLLAREPSREPPVIRTWWPPAFPLPPQVKAGARTVPRLLFMARALNGASLPERAEDVFYWHGDVF